MASGALGTVFLPIMGIAAIVLGEWWGIITLVLTPVELAWFIYFYKRRVMFGAKRRWKWLERTFPNLVGPEEETHAATVELRSQEIPTPQKRPSEKEVYTGGEITLVKEEPEYLNKQCPRCAEQIYLEDTNCRYCNYQFDLEELAAAIARILNERKAEFAKLIDFSSATKQCPACFESIKLEALICRYCRREFTNAAVQISKVQALREKLRHVR